jgi:hypothetical protein
LVFKHLILVTLRKKRRCVKKKRDVYNFTKDSVIASIGDIQKVRVMLLNEKYDWRSILLQVCPCCLHVVCYVHMSEVCVFFNGFREFEEHGTVFHMYHHVIATYTPLNLVPG